MYILKHDIVLLKYKQFLSVKLGEMRYIKYVFNS